MAPKTFTTVKLVSMLRRSRTKGGSADKQVKHIVRLAQQKNKGRSPCHTCANVKLCTHGVCIHVHGRTHKRTHYTPAHESAGPTSTEHNISPLNTRTRCSTRPLPLPPHRYLRWQFCGVIFGVFLSTQEVVRLSWK